MITVRKALRHAGGTLMQGRARLRADYTDTRCREDGRCSMNFDLMDVDFIRVVELASPGQCWLGNRQRR